MTPGGVALANETFARSLAGYPDIVSNATENPPGA
jgi:hypothetical protein